MGHAIVLLWNFDVALFVLFVVVVKLKLQPFADAKLVVREI